MSLTLPYPDLSGVVDDTKLEANQNAVVAKFGNIDNSDIKNGAAISVDKLSASYEYLPISVRLADGTAANDVLVPLYNDSKGDWSAVAAQWATDDTGAPTGVITIAWGVLDGSGTTSVSADWTNVTTVATITLAGANIASQGVQTTVTSPAFGGAGVYRSLRFYMSTTDAAATAPIFVTLLLKRQIKT
jgi:hypothetical protein